MGKHSKTVSGMYPQFEQREAHPKEKKKAHPLEKYIGRLAYFCGEKLEVVGYRNDAGNARLLIADGTKIKACGWKMLDAWDVVFKNCESYCYVIADDLIYKKS